MAVLTPGARVLLFSLAILAISPFLFVFFFIPILIRRQTLAIVYKWRHPGSQGALGTHSTLWYRLAPAPGTTNDKQQRWILSNKDQLTILLSVKVEGATFDMPAFRALLSSQILERGGGGRLLHPELQQYPDLWMGHLFWKPDPSFAIDNHVHLYKGDGYREDRDTPRRDSEFCYNFLRAYCEQPLAADRSPWEITIIENVTEDGHGQRTGDPEPCTLLVFKCAHYFADGYAIYNLVARFADGGAASVRRPQPNLPSRWRRFADIALYPFKGPLEFVASVYRESVGGGKSWPGATEEWPPPYTATDVEVGLDGNDKSLALSGRIPAIGAMRLKAKHHGVSLTTVILVSCARALRRHLQQQHRFSSIPPDAYLKCSLPFPAPNHAPGLTNDICIATVSIPLGGPDTSFAAQLQDLEAQLAAVKRSTIPMTMSLLWSVFGTLPVTTWMWKGAAIFGRVYTDDSAATIFPGPSNTFVILGRKVIGMNMLLGGSLCPSHIFYLFILTYNGNVEFWVATRPDIATGDEVLNLARFIEEEMTGAVGNSI